MTIPIRPLRAAAFALVLASLLGGVAQAQQPSPSGSPTGPLATVAPRPPATASPFAAVPGSSWTVRAFDADGEGLVEPRRNALVTLELLVDGRLQGETDCGTYFGGYVLDGAGISLSVIDTGTEPCGSRREAEVVSLIAVLEAAATWEGTATGTVLLDAEGIIRVELEPATQKGLAGAWLATALATPGGVLQAVPPTTPVELAFGAGGGLTGTTGCRLFEGEYLSEADQALLVPTDTTGLPCEGDLQALEERFLEALQAVILWERNGAELRLTDAVGNVLIELIATSG